MNRCKSKEKEYLYCLCQIPGMGAVTIKKLWKQYGSFETIYNIEGNELSKKKLNADLEEYHNLEKRGIQFISILDDSYPKRLREIYGNPMGLYVKGKLPEEDKPAVAIIGARNCSNYGKQVAEYMGSALSREGIRIISGLALGIDGAGHRGALREEQATYAVLGCGVNICYPKENYSLYEAMVERGGIISECRLSEAPISKNFPMRNRIISGMADVILVIEARERSGSLITVEYALEQGKEVYAVPGQITDQLSKGCNHLIQSGANILTSPQDILEYFEIKNEKMLTVHEKNGNTLVKKEKMLYSCLDFQPKFIEQIVKESGLTVGECMTILLELELGGYIVQTASQYYGKKL